MHSKMPRPLKSCLHPSFQRWSVFISFFFSYRIFICFPDIIFLSVWLLKCSTFVAWLQNSWILCHLYLVNFKSYPFLFHSSSHIVFSYVSWHNFSFCLANKMFDVRCIVWYCVISKVICFYFVLLFILYFNMFHDIIFLSVF